MLRSSTRGSAGWGTGDSPLPFRSPLEREFSRVVVTRSCLRSCIWHEGIDVRFCQVLMGFASFSVADRSSRTSVYLFSSSGRWTPPRVICSGHCRRGLSVCRVCPLGSSPRRSCLDIPPGTPERLAGSASSSPCRHARKGARPTRRPNTPPRSAPARRARGRPRHNAPAGDGVAQGCSLGASSDVSTSRCNLTWMSCSSSVAGRADQGSQPSPPHWARDPRDLEPPTGRR